MSEEKRDERSNRLIFVILASLAVMSILVPVSLAERYSGIRGASADKRVAVEADSVANADEVAGQDMSLDNLVPLNEVDHIRGNRDAVVQLINYSDYLCPFCQKFHDTLLDVVSDYGPSDLVWVSRHLPIIGGDNSMNLARGSECAFEQGGESAFTKYSDLVYEKVTENGLSGKEFALAVAREISLNVGDFTSCIESSRHDELINAQTESAFAIGANGTPFSVVVAPDGTKYPINGAQSATAVHQIIKTALGKDPKKD